MYTMRHCGNVQPFLNFTSSSNAFPRFLVLYGHGDDPLIASMIFKLVREYFHTRRSRGKRDNREEALQLGKLKHSDLSLKHILPMRISQNLRRHCKCQD